MYHAIDGVAPTAEQTSLNQAFLRAKWNKEKYKVFSGWTIWKNLTVVDSEAYGDAEMFVISHFQGRDQPLIGD